MYFMLTQMKTRCCCTAPCPKQGAGMINPGSERAGFFLPQDRKKVNEIVSLMGVIPVAAHVDGHLQGHPQGHDLFHLLPEEGGHRRHFRLRRL